MPIRYKILSRYRYSFFAEGDYSLHYPKDETVKALPGTLGIMVFDTFANAVAFRGTVYKECPIVKVKPIGRGKKQPEICAFISQDRINDFYQLKFDFTVEPSPIGTICYPAVEVLE